MIINEKTGNIFYDETLIKRGTKCIDWVASCGVSFKIKYYGELYEFKIININPKNKKVILEYLGVNKKPISYTLIKNCKIGSVIGKVTIDFKIEIGHIFNDEKRYLTIMDREYRFKRRKDNKSEHTKWYKYKCNNCENSDWIEESRLLTKKNGCNVCGKIAKKVTIYNCLATKRPDLMIYLSNKDDGYKYTCGSNQLIKCKCPDCYEEKEVNINSFTNEGFSCSRCSDGISYPNKLMSNILTYLKIKYVREYSPSYLKRKMSDFYIPNQNLVIEMDGRLGHEGGVAFDGSENTLYKRVELDKWKDERHLIHGIKTIRIDCFESNIKYIKNSILNSELVNYFDFSKVDWIFIDELSHCNKLKQACSIKMENPYITVREISTILEVSVDSIRNYLFIGNENGWCKYNPTDELTRRTIRNNSLKRKSIEVLKNGISIGVFESGTELERLSEKLFGEKLRHSAISRVCNNKKPQYKGYTFRYIDNNKTEVS